MSSITAQQTKLDLELVPNEKRLKIGKCNGRINPGKKQKEPTFQVILDALALTPRHYAFLTTTDETKAYKTYLSYAIGFTPPKKARKFKKPASPKLSTRPASPEEPIRKLKRVKRPPKKPSDAPTVGVVIRETPIKSLSKKKENITVEKRKGIDLLSELALTEEAYAAKIKPSVRNEGTGVKPGVPDMTEEESTKNEVESWGRDEDDNNNDHDSRSKGSDQERDSEENGEDIEDDEEEDEDEFVKTPSNDTNDEDETKIKHKTKGDEDEGMDYTTNQFNDDVNVRLNEPVTTD
nr:hypothetical protein [Tanacetum cinerariifolium]